MGKIFYLLLNESYLDQLQEVKCKKHSYNSAIIEIPVLKIVLKEQSNTIETVWTMNF